MGTAQSVLLRQRFLTFLSVATRELCRITFQAFLVNHQAPSEVKRSSRRRCFTKESGRPSHSTVVYLSIIYRLVRPCFDTEMVLRAGLGAAAAWRPAVASMTTTMRSAKRKITRAQSADPQRHLMTDDPDTRPVTAEGRPGHMSARELST